MRHIVGPVFIGPLALIDRRALADKLEGSLIRLIAYASLTGAEISV